MKDSFWLNNCPTTLLMINVFPLILTPSSDVLMDNILDMVQYCWVLIVVILLTSDSCDMWPSYPGSAETITVSGQHWLHCSHHQHMLLQWTRYCRCCSDQPTPTCCSNSTTTHRNKIFFPNIFHHINFILYPNYSFGFKVLIFATKRGAKNLLRKFVNVFVLSQFRFEIIWYLSERAFITSDTPGHVQLIVVGGVDAGQGCPAGDCCLVTVHDVHRPGAGVDWAATDLQHM